MGFSIGMANKETTAEIGIDVVGGDLKGTLEFIERKVALISKMVADAGNLAVKSTGTVNKDFDLQMKSMQATLGQLRTIQGQIQGATNAGKSGVNNAVADKAFAKRTMDATTYAKTLQNTQSLQDSFQARMNTLDKQNSAIGSRNEILSRKQEVATLAARKNLEELRRIDAETARLDTKARRTDGSFSTERRGVTSARSALEAAAANPRRSNFTPEMTALNAALDTYNHKLSNTRAEKAAILKEDMQAHKNRIAAMNEEQATYKIIMAEEAALKRAARVEEVERHRIRILNIKDEGRAYAQSLTTTGAVSRARTSNGFEINTARAELRDPATSLERQRQLHLEINALQSIESALKQRSVSIQAESNSQASVSLRYQRELNAAEVRAMTTLEQISTARLVAQRLITQATEQGTVATHAQQRAANQLLETERQRITALNRREAEITPKSSTNPGLFGSAGIGGIIARTAMYAAVGTAIYATVGALKDGEAASIDFEKKLDELGAISGSTETQMTKLGGSILQVARNSRFSASELTEAATQLAQAGYSASGIEASLKSANDLAIGSGSSVVQSVDVMTATMGAFQLQEQDATRVADGLTAALNKSRLALPQVALGIQYAGVTAHEQNISFEDLTSSMAAMAQAGVRSGSTMGTGFRQFITDLASPTQKLSATLTRLGLSFADVDVSTIGIEQVIKNLSAAGFSAAEAYGSMEKRGAAAYLAMRSQLPTFDQVKIAMNQQGTAADAAAKAADNLAGAWQRAKNRMFAGWEQGAGPMNKWMTEHLNMLGQSEDANKLFQKYRADRAALGNSPGAGLGATRSQADEYTEKGRELYKNYRLELEKLTAAEKLASDVNNQFSASLEVANTKANEASEAYNAGKVSLNSFEESMQSVIQRSGSLKDGSAALQTETVALMNRYPDLARNVDVASNSYAGLLNAMRQARGEMLATNAVLADGMAATQAGLGQENKEKGEAFGHQVQNSAGFKEFTPEEIKVWQYYKSHANDPVALAKLSGLAGAKQGDSQALRATRKLIGNTQSVMTTRVGNQQSETSAKATAAELRASQTPNVVSAAKRVDALSTPGTTEAAKKKLIGELTGAVTFDTKAGNTATAAAYQHLLERAQTTLNNTGHLAEPKPVREKSVPNPKQTQAAAISIAQSQGLKINSAGRPTWTREEVKGGPKSQETLYNTVRTKQNPVAKPGTGKHEYRNGSEALDIAFQPGLTEAGLRKMYADRGFPLTDVRKESGHWHIEWNGKKRMTKANLENSSSLATAREDMSEDQFAYKNATKKLSSSMADLTRATTKAGLDQSIADTTSTFNDWKKKLIASTNSEISAKGFGANNAQDRLNEMQDMIQQKKEDIGQAIADAIVKSAEAQLKSIEKAYDRALAPTNEATATAQGALDGLSRYGIAKGVPDYVRVLAQKKVNQAQEAGLQAAMPAKKIELDQSKAVLSSAQAGLQAHLANGDLSPQQLAEAQLGILNLQSAVDALSASYANMVAQAGAPSMIVTGLTANLRQAVEAWQEVNVSTKNYNQLLSEEVGPALDTLKGSFSTFFSDIMSGSVSVGTAFGNMAKTIIRAIQDIIAKLIATKLIELLTNLALSFMGPSMSKGPATGGAIGKSSAGMFKGSFNGGRVLGRAGGGKINTGFEGRDSTLYNLAKNEWVVRGAAARSVGDEFMRDLNDNGAHALRRRTSMSVMPPPAHQEVKVYVVAPTEKPSMGPNDVTVHMQAEMLRDGATKKIIKHISQGG